MCDNVDCDFDILMMVVRCFAEKGQNFVARVGIGFVLDVIESLSIEFSEIDEDINIYLIVPTAVLYVILCICIADKHQRGEAVYKFNYIFFSS